MSESRTLESEVERVTRIYEQSYGLAYKALREAGVESSRAQFLLHRELDYATLMPDEVIKYYKKMRTDVIMYLNTTIGLSIREIARRIGGSSYHIVLETVNNFTHNNDTS